ncbi:MAG TPA: alpha/beta hydrolase [Myxococcota bacterium]|nr:alpha/beta hydrolase [Myxococcota bacterium]
MPYVEGSDGAKIFWRASGDGPPLLLSCASFSTHLHWAGQEAALARFVRVVSWDYRGHGQSDAPEEPARYTLEQVVDDLGRVHAAAAGGEPAFAAGLSVGGIVSLAYARARPERVRGLILCNTGPGFKNPEALAQWQAMLERSAAKFGEVGIERYLEGSRAQAELLGLDPGSGLAAEARRGVLSSSVGGLQRFARGVAGPVPNLVDVLGEIRQPALILVGEKDANFQRASHVMAAKLPQAERVEIAGAGHVLNLDQPEAFVREIERFVRAQVQVAGS